MRLGELARVLDPLTRRWILERGLGPGWRCLEVGAGLGSVSRWLADRVGASGSVVCCDIDVRFLGESDRANLEVRALDVRSDLIEPSHFDLACCRTLLMHLDDPKQALRRMIEALRPGGWLVVQEPDVGAVSAEDLEHPDAEEFHRIHHKLYSWLRARRVFDASFGRRLPRLLESLGLIDVGCEGMTSVVRGGSPDLQLTIRTLTAMEPLLMKRGALEPGEFEFLLRLHADPCFGQLGTLQMGAWGRRPEDT
jgi:SAM-dependent methyltransferase